MKRELRCPHCHSYSMEGDPHDCLAPLIASEELAQVRASFGVPAPRPRVEGERVRLLAEEHPGHIGLKTIRDLALDLLDERAEVTRLTAEVERLRECGIAFLYAVEGEGICEVPSARDRRVFGNALKDAPHGRCPSCEKPWPAPLDLVAEAHCSCGHALALPTPAPEATDA